MEGLLFVTQSTGDQASVMIDSTQTMGSRTYSKNLFTPMLFLNETIICIY